MNNASRTTVESSELLRLINVPIATRRDVRILITLIFPNGEVVVSDVAFDHEPTPAEVRRAANKVARERGARKVVLPPEWRRGGD